MILVFLSNCFDSWSASMKGRAEKIGGQLAKSPHFARHKNYIVNNLCLLQANHAYNSTSK